jgi:hypothetical protein
MLSPSVYTVLSPIKMAENIIINELLNNPFSVGPLHDKLRIMNKGRPTPWLHNLITHHKTKTERYIRRNSICQCEKFDWVIGRETTKKLYFWSCSPFYNKHEWLLGFKSFASAQKKHSKSQIHAHCYIQLKLFIKQQRIDLLLDAESRKDVTWHNEQFKKNKRILRRFIDAVCSLAKQEFLFLGHDGSPASLNNRNFMEFLNVFKNHDPLLKNHLNLPTAI